MAQCRPADVEWLDYLDYDGSPMLLIKRSDPHAKEIIAGSHHVAVLTCNHETKEWLETYPQASVFIYSRNVEPKHVLCLLDHTSGSLELILLTSVKKFHFDAPCLFLKDEFGLIRCFQFITKDDYKRIGKLVHYIMYRSQQETKYVSLLSLLADAQGIFDNSDQSIQDNTALSPETRTTTESSNVMNTLRNVRNERNEKVPPYESVTPASLPLYESVTPTASPTFDIPYHATTLPASSKYISNFLNPAVNHVNKSSDVVKKQTLNQANQVIPPLVRKVPTSSNISAKHKAKYKMNNAVPSFSRTTSTSSAMSSLEAVNAAMEHDLYQVDNRIRIPSYSSISSDSASSTCSMTTASTRSMTSASTRSMTTDDVPKKRKSAAPIRVDQLEKRQKTVVSFLSATSPNQPKLCSPLMFMERNTLPKEINASTTTNERTGVFRISKSKRHDGNPESYTQNSTTHLPSTEQEHKSEPLTQNQLLQAVSHLIRTDESFMHKLHAAYLESFIDILPKTN